jgi:hypothetical protein
MPGPDDDNPDADWLGPVESIGESSLAGVAVEDQPGTQGIKGSIGNHPELQAVPARLRVCDRDEGHRWKLTCVWAGIATLAGLILAGWGGFRLWPRTIEVRPAHLTPVCERVGARDVVTLPGRFLVAQIGAYDDELFAYLMFQYFAGATPFRNAEVLLTYRRINNRLVYPIEVRFENDLLASLSLLARAQVGGLFKQYEWRYINEDTLSRFRYQTQVFRTAYNLETNRKIEGMSRAELISYVRRFVQFKSAVDPRIRRKIEPVPRPLTRGEAHQLAMDILAVTDFYSLPLEFFLGIGAMENNYMNVKGDLNHAVWKKHAGPGDIIVKRRPGRVMVLNPASGVWQITRETLRHVHNLYLADRRDYSVLPEHLRPARTLNLAELQPEILTTYAGLLFRQLLDLFHGDVSAAVGAYNGGPRNPNPRYEEGVRMVADYARRIMQQAAVLHGQPAAGMRFLSPAR